MEDNNLNKEESEIKLLDVEDLVSKKLKNLSDEEIEKQGKKIYRDKKISFIVACIISGFVFLSGIVVLIVGACLNWSGGSKSGYLGLCIGCMVFGIIILLVTIRQINPKMFKWSAKEWVTFEEKKKLEEVNKDVQKAKDTIDYFKQIDGKEIKSVFVVDTYTEYSDKLHAILNYQEIIQTRMYKFLVTFEDGSSKFYTEKEGSKKYNILIQHVNFESSSNESPMISNADELRKFKELLDEGVISQEEFDKKKNELLNK